MKKYLFIIASILIASTLLIVGNAKAIGRCELEVTNGPGDDPCVVINDLEPFDEGYQSYYRECGLSKIIERINENKNYCKFRTAKNVDSIRTFNMVLFQPNGVPDHELKFSDITESTETKLKWLEAANIKRSTHLVGWKFAFDNYDNDICLGDPNSNGNCDKDSNSSSSKSIFTEKNWDKDHNVSILIPDRRNSKTYKSKLIIEGPDEDCDHCAMPGFELKNKKALLSLNEMEIEVENGRSLVVVEDGGFFMANTHIETKNAAMIFRGPSSSMQTRDAFTEAYGFTHLEGSMDELGDNVNNIEGTIEGTVFDFTNKMPNNFDPVKFFNEDIKTRFKELEFGSNPLYRFSYGIADVASALVSCTMIDENNCSLNMDIAVFAIDRDGYVVEMKTDNRNLDLSEIRANGVYFTRNGKRLFIDGYRYESSGSSEETIECNLLPTDTSEPTIICPISFVYSIVEGINLYSSSSSKTPSAKMLKLGDILTIKAFNNEDIEEIDDSYFDEQNREIKITTIESFKAIHCSVTTNSCNDDAHECALSCSDEFQLAAVTTGGFRTYTLSSPSLSDITFSNDGHKLIKKVGINLDLNAEYITPMGEMIVLHACENHSTVNSDGMCTVTKGFELSIDGENIYPECEGKPVPSADGKECVCKDPNLEPVNKYSDVVCLQPCEDGETRSWTGRCVAEEDEINDTSKTTQPEVNEDENKEIEEFEEDLSSQENDWGDLIGDDNNSDDDRAFTDTAVEAGGCTLAPNTSVSTSSLLSMMFLTLITGLGLIRRRTQSR